MPHLGQRGTKRTRHFNKTLVSLNGTSVFVYKILTVSRIIKGVQPHDNSENSVAPKSDKPSGGNDRQRSETNERNNQNPQRITHQPIAQKQPPLPEQADGGHERSVQQKPKQRSYERGR